MKFWPTFLVFMLFFQQLWKADKVAFLGLNGVQFPIAGAFSTSVLLKLVPSSRF
jgi:hypothetical protein